MNIKLSLEYEGTNYAGWQRQKNSLAVQNVLEKAIKKIYNEDIQTIGSGRTDKGVHAEQQIALFKTDNTRIPINKLSEILNNQLPHDIRVAEAENVNDDFHPRFSAKVRMYRYILSKKETNLIHNRFSYYPDVLMSEEKNQIILRAPHRHT